MENINKIKHLPRPQNHVQPSKLNKIKDLPKKPSENMENQVIVE